MINIRDVNSISIDSYPLAGLPCVRDFKIKNDKLFYSALSVWLLCTFPMSQAAIHPRVVSIKKRNI